jgi:hypothetical protein
VKDGGCCVTCLLGINCGEQLLHGARRRCAEPLVEVDRLRKLLADEVIVPREFGVVRERLLNTIGVAAAQPPPPRSDRTTPVRRRGRRSVTHRLPRGCDFLRSGRDCSGGVPYLRRAANRTRSRRHPARCEHRYGPHADPNGPRRNTGLRQGIPPGLSHPHQAKSSICLIVRAIDR